MAVGSDARLAVTTNEMIDQALEFLQPSDDLREAAKGIVSVILGGPKASCLREKSHFKSLYRACVYLYTVLNDPKSLANYQEGAKFISALSSKPVGLVKLRFTNLHWNAVEHHHQIVKNYATELFSGLINVWRFDIDAAEKCLLALPVGLSLAIPTYDPSSLANTPDFPVILDWVYSALVGFQDFVVPKALENHPLFGPYYPTFSYAERAKHDVLSLKSVISPFEMCIARICPALKMDSALALAEKINEENGNKRYAFDLDIFRDLGKIGRVLACPEFTEFKLKMRRAMNKGRTQFLFHFKTLDKAIYGSRLFRMAVLHDPLSVVNEDSLMTGPNPHDIYFSSSSKQSDGLLVRWFFAERTIPENVPVPLPWEDKAIRAIARLNWERQVIVPVLQITDNTNWEAVEKDHMAAIQRIIAKSVFHFDYAFQVRISEKQVDLVLMDNSD